jgi:hypothetical protein
LPTCGRQSADQRSREAVDPRSTGAIACGVDRWSTSSPVKPERGFSHGFETHRAARRTAAATRRHGAGRPSAPRRAPSWARCLGYGLASLAATAAWLCLGLFVALSAALGDDNGAPPEWLAYAMPLIPIAGGLSLLTSAISAGLDRSRMAWWALSAAAGCLATWVPLAFLTASDWS